MYFKRNALSIFGLCITMIIQAMVSKTVNVSAGGLSTALTSTDAANITNLTLTGSIDARDVAFIRDNISNLSILDISAVAIHAYSGSGGTVGVSTSFPANQMPLSSFAGKTTISSMVLPNSLTSVGDWAFNGCTGLSSLTIPSTVTTIGSYALYGCIGLTNMTIPNAVTTLGAGAFGSCSGITNMTIGNSVNTFGNDVFNGCTGLASLTIPSSVTSIGDWTFENCSKLTSLAIPNSVKSIGNGTFYGCTRLASVTIPSSVTSIGQGAFFDCTGLTSIAIPNSVTTIASSAFCNCTGLVSMTIGDAVTSVGDWAFYTCSGLTSISIGKSVSSYGDYAFGNCSKLATINSLATSPTALTSSVFDAVNKSTCTLYVPTSSKSAYQVTSSWNEFSNIVAGVITGIVDTPTGKGITIYPNPATDGFNINGLEGNGTITLTDITGKMLLNKPVKDNEYVSVSSLPAGLYIARIATANGTIKQKVIKK